MKCTIKNSSLVLSLIEYFYRNLPESNPGTRLVLGQKLTQYRVFSTLQDKKVVLYFKQSNESKMIDRWKRFMREEIKRCESIEFNPLQLEPKFKMNMHTILTEKMNEISAYNMYFSIDTPEEEKESLDSKVINIVYLADYSEEADKFYNVVTDLIDENGFEENDMTYNSLHPLAVYSLKDDIQKINTEAELLQIVILNMKFLDNKIVILARGPTNKKKKLKKFINEHI